MNINKILLMVIRDLTHNVKHYYHFASTNSTHPPLPASFDSLQFSVVSGHFTFMKWFWCNTTQVGFGADAVKEHIPKFVQPGWKVLCTFGGGSIEKNGARSDVQAALDQLKCEVRWEGGIPPNPEYNRLIEIAAVARAWKPDLLLAVGGGSILDGTKFISCAAVLPEGEDAWETVIVKHSFTGTPLRLAAVMTLPATGSEWNNGFVVSRRSIKAKLAGAYPGTYPFFSLLDPKYTMTLPPRQLRNGVYDAITHCIDLFLTPQRVPMMDHFWMAVMKELVDIGPEVVKEGSSLELHERLIMAASFALNQIFCLGKEGCAGIHMIGHQLTSKYGIDHGATLAIVTGPFLETQFEARKPLLAETAEYVFGVREGTEDEKARAFIDRMNQFIETIGQPRKVSDWEGVKVEAGDVEEVTKMVMESVGGKPFGHHGCGTEEVCRKVLQQVIA